MKKILIDTDPGMDDSLAIILAARSDAVEPVAITSVAGNKPVAMTTTNALKTLELIGRTDIPVSRGMGKPLARALPPDPFSHGSDGMAEAHFPEPTTAVTGQHAVSTIVETARQLGPDLTIVALGPLTNIAMAVMMEPEVMRGIAEIVCIAGSYGLNRQSFVNATGDNPQSEWNVYVDPEAAKTVFESGIPIRAIGLDVATQFDADLTPEQFAALERSERPDARYVDRMIKFVHGRGYQSYCVMIDSMAVAAVIDPTLVETIPARVGVETKGEITLGQTVADFRHSHVWQDLPVIKVGMRADYRRFLDLTLAAVGI